MSFVELKGRSVAEQADKHEPAAGWEIAASNLIPKDHAADDIVAVLRDVEYSDAIIRNRVPNPRKILGLCEGKVRAYSSGG